MTDWLPIDTAPKDGTEVLLWGPPRIAEWSDEQTAIRIAQSLWGRRWLRFFTRNEEEKHRLATLYQVPAMYL